MFNSRVFTLILLFIFSLPSFAWAEEVEVFNEYQGTFHGKVSNIIKEEMQEIPGTGTDYLFQTLEIEVLDGPQAGQTVTIENDYVELDKGDKFYFNYNVHRDGTERYSIVHIDRKGSLFLLVAIFVVAIIIFGGWQGVRSLLALAGSFFAIFYVLMPGLVAGWNPLVASFVIASGILFAAIFFTHGFNRESAVAYFGTMIAVLITALFAIFSVNITDLSGFAAEGSVSLNFNTRGSLDFISLLLGAIIIGVLGVLDDIAVTQSAVVTELYDSNPQISRIEVYRRAMRIGREHVGALVNTLVLAYTGASLPLLLYFYLSPTSFMSSINSELFATEIVRAIVGSIGLILTVPIVTLLAVFYLKGYKSKHGGHGHSHGH